MSDEASPLFCEFAWVSEEPFDFVSLQEALTAIKDAVGVRGISKLTLAGQPEAPGMLLVLRFPNRTYSSTLRRVIAQGAAKLRCQPFDFLLTSKAERDRLQERLGAMAVTVEATAPSQEFIDQFRERMGLKP